MAKRNITLHDKYKSTTALYPKIDASSFTQGAIEKVAEISKEEVENNVVPNETPTGTPTELQYITINGVEYYIKEGTLVIANPTLAGTEADLTGIQIGDIKYKISAGGGSGTHLYLHNITFYKTDQETKVGVSIINSVSTAYDNINDIANWLKNNGFTSDNSKTYNCVGSGYYSSALKCYYSCCYILSSSKDSVRIFYYNSAGNGSFNTWNSDTTNLTLTDTVIDLGVASGGGGGTQVQSNWNETDTTSPAYIQNKPSLFSGNYNDLTNKPTLWAHYFRLFYTMADGTFVYIMGLIINNSNVDLSFASIRSYLGTLTNNIQRISVSGYCYNSSSQLYESITSLYKYNYDNNSLYFDGERTGTITINDAPSVSDCKVQIL